MNLENHTQILNFLIERYNLKSYLEIGVKNKDNNFNLIKLDEHQKVCVDPDPEAQADFIGTSDEYFAKVHGAEFDCIFLDGLHTAEQVEKDFNNALTMLSRYGFICIHDTVPEKEEYTIVPRETKIWNGSVYKFACTLCHYDFIEFKTFPQDHGLTVVWRNKNKGYNKMIEDITWEYFSLHKSALLRFDTVLPNEKYFNK